MQDYSDRQKLLKQIDQGLTDIQKLEEKMATLRLELSNSSKRFMLSSRLAVTNTSLIAFRQRLGKLSAFYVDLEEKVYDIMEVVDQVEP
jgi:hypothetical protein